MTTHDTITRDVIQEITAAISAGETVRHRLPRSGLLYFERQLPFLFIYRRPASQEDPGTDRLITSEAAYLIGTHDKRLQASQADLVRALVQTLEPMFGGFLLLELRASSAGVLAPEDDTPPPVIRVREYNDERGGQLVGVLRQALATDRRLRGQWRIAPEATMPRLPKVPAPILSKAEARELNCFRLLLEVPAVFRDRDTQKVFPAVLRSARKVVTTALRKTAFEFAKTQTTHKLKSFHTVGRRALVKVVWQVDAQLAELASQFDFLLALTPTNVDQAWSAFRRNKFERAPDLHYRQLTIDISQAKRQLFSIPIERIEDPTVAELFFEKQLELDRQLTILVDRGSKKALFGSLQLYGGVEAELLNEADRLIERISPGAREVGDTRRVTAVQVAARAEEELDWYRASGLQVDGAGVDLREDIAAGLMVSRGRLLIAAGTTYPASRVEALIQHEVGTHVLTYLNGRTQRLKLLSVGLAAYDQTQEGLGVLAEYLVGGLSKPRMRLLAGRVVVTNALITGADFVEAFRLLLRYGFSQRVAFSIVVRAYRGGGITKDAVYLKGLMEITEYLGAGEALGVMYIGKIARHHVGIIKGLQAQGILPASPFLPRFLQDGSATGRLAKVQGGCRPHDLVEERE